MEEQRKYQYWLRSVSGIRNKMRQRLVDCCGSAKDVYELEKEQLEQINGIREKEIDALLASKNLWDMEKKEEELEKKGISIVTTEDENFPERLRYLYDCPYALFYKGKLPTKDEKTAAIVGARLCSSYGRRVALELGEKLSACGMGVVSGMATGIDSFGHWGAIHGKGNTYAVLGCGVEVCYPKGARELYERIIASGGIISEYLPESPPLAKQFPARNRLISGLSDVVLIVEAKRKSGSLITADFALEQGKEVYAVPGRIDDTLSMGCNDLIKQGAGVITDTEELLIELGFLTQGNSTETEKNKNLLEKEEALVYSCFDLHTKNMEELVQLTKIPASEMADILVRLEHKGFVEEHFKNHYRKK